MKSKTLLILRVLSLVLEFLKHSAAESPKTAYLKDQCKKIQEEISTLQEEEYREYMRVNGPRNSSVCVKEAA